MRRSSLKHLAILGLVLTAALSVLAAFADSQANTVEAENKPGAGPYGEERHAWVPTALTVGEGGVVTFANHTAINHGVEWVSTPGGATPSCSGVPVGSSVEAAAKEWSGTCTFTHAGTYTFYCTVHGPEMTGTIVVSANAAGAPAASPPASETPPLAPGAPPGASGSVAPAPSSGPLLAGGFKALRLAPRQRGAVVHGSIRVAPAGAGGKLEVALLAAGASRAGAKPHFDVRVGRLLRFAVKAGTVSFAVALDAKGRAALRHKKELALRVRIVLAPAHGAAAALTRALTLRA